MSTAVESAKRILIVVDYQNDFVDGTLGFEGAAELDTKIAATVGQYLKRGDRVIFTRDTHTVGYLKTREGRALPIGHCIDGTDGDKVYGETGRVLETYISDKVMNSRPEDVPSLVRGTLKAVDGAKHCGNVCVIRKSTFGSKELLHTLEQMAADTETVEIELCGLVSYICVLSNAVIAQAALPNAQIIVNEQLTSGPDSALTEKAMDILHVLQARVINDSSTWDTKEEELWK